MSVLVGPVTDERDALVKYLAAQRRALRASVFGIDRALATSAPAASSLSLAGLIKHAAHCERGWIAQRLGGRTYSPRDYAADFVLDADESLEDVLALLDEIGEETEQVLRELPDLDVRVPVPTGVPWFPDDLEYWTARWIVLHMIEELARHAGHADIIRETIDGSNAFVLQAKAAGENPQWLQMLEAK